MHSPPFKEKVAPAALNGDKMLAESAEQFEVRPAAANWKKQLQDRVDEGFEAGRTSAEPSVDLKVLHAKVGQLRPREGPFGRHARQGRIVSVKCTTFAAFCGSL